jgi:CitMHS family citrate-Mg2+:H+ or citrate-Ca2+:H+ symporter
VNNKWVLLVFMAVFMLVPGALTGAGSVSIFVVGGLVATVVRYMGLSERKTVAFVFIFAILSAAAPPINLWTMLMTAQANMPYVGFTKLLLIPILIVGAFSIIYLGFGSKRESKEKILAELPEAAANMGWFRILAPLVILAALIILSLYLPFSTPVLGLPLIFVLATICAIACNPKKTTIKEYYGVVAKTMEQVFPLLATVISVGVLVNVMAATGVRGLLGITFVTLPTIFIYLTVLFFCPFAQGSLSYGSAIIFGTPLIFMFNAAGMDTTVVAAALSLIFPIGDCLPPSRIVGRVSIETVGYKGSYMSFLKQIFLPVLLLGALALIMLIIPNRFSFLK